MITQYHVNVNNIVTVITRKNKHQGHMPANLHYIAYFHLYFETK